MIKTGSAAAPPEETIAYHVSELRRLLPRIERGEIEDLDTLVQDVQAAQTHHGWLRERIGRIHRMLDGELDRERADRSTTIADDEAEDSGKPALQPLF